MKNQKIVLIEDDEILAKVLKEELAGSDFDVLSAYDGEAGLKLVQKEKPDLLLLDILLPKMHGLDVLKILKSKEETKGIPVIALTMLGQDEDIKKGFELGVDDYIVKSQHAVAEIVEKVKSFFSKETHPGIQK